MTETMRTTGMPPAVSAPAGGLFRKVSATLLFPHRRTGRPPLEPWAASLCRLLDEVIVHVRPPRELAARAAGLSNGAALISAHEGRFDLAKRICLDYATWVLRLGRRSRDEAMTVFAVDPWINLGRLEAYSGAYPEALARFAVLERRLPDGSIRLGDVVATPSGWNAVRRLTPDVANMTFDDILSWHGMQESLKTYVTNGRFEDGLVYAERAERAASSPFLRGLARETAIASLSGLGCFEEAWQRALSASRECHGFASLAFRIRLAEALQGMARVEDARAESTAVATELLALPRKMPPGGRYRTQTLYMLLRASTLSADLGRTQDELDLARFLVHAARRSNDEAFEIEGLRILARNGPDARRERWSRALEELTQRTAYRRYRSHPCEASSPSIQRLYDRLLELCAN